MLSRCLVRKMANTRGSSVRQPPSRRGDANKGPRPFANKGPRPAGGFANKGPRPAGGAGADKTTRPTKNGPPTQNGPPRRFNRVLPRRRSNPRRHLIPESVVRALLSKTGVTRMEGVIPLLVAGIARKAIEAIFLQLCRKVRKAQKRGVPNKKIVITPEMMNEAIERAILFRSDIQREDYPV